MLVDQDFQDLMDPIKEEVVLVKVDLFSLILLSLVVAVVELVVMVVKTLVVLVDLVAAVMERTLVVTATTVEPTLAAVAADQVRAIVRGLVVLV